MIFAAISVVPDLILTFLTFGEAVKSAAFSQWVTRSDKKSKSPPGLSSVYSAFGSGL